MRSFPVLSLVPVILSLGCPPPLGAQDAGDQFTSENAILNTAIPFAIGAREARQEIRGSFGWPTFQEGLVEGVYFRFDPDGYARFAPNPRLDSNVFEVICRTRTTTCIGRKAALSLLMDGQGLIQIKIEGLLEGDKLFLVEGITEIPLPDTILMPLDSRMETLLGSGGELIVRRGEDRVARVSLTGFTAVVAYLRWLEANQDYSVLPANWPVPNSNTQPTTITQNANWQSPMQQPQNLPVFQREISAPKAEVQQEFARVRTELGEIREILTQDSSRLLNQANDTPSDLESTEQITNTVTSSFAAVAPPKTATTPDSSFTVSQIAELLGRNQPQVEPSHTTTNVVAGHPSPSTEYKVGTSFSSKLDYLITEIGLDAHSALILLQQQMDQGANVSQQPKPTTDDQIIQLLQSMATADPTSGVSESSRLVIQSDNISDEDYVTLSQYFQFRMSE